MSELDQEDVLGANEFDDEPSVVTKPKKKSPIALIGGVAAVVAIVGLGLFKIYGPLIMGQSDASAGYIPVEGAYGQTAPAGGGYADPYAGQAQQPTPQATGFGQQQSVGQPQGNQFSQPGMSQPVTQQVHDYQQQAIESPPAPAQVQSAQASLQNLSPEPHRSEAQAPQDVGVGLSAPQLQQVLSYDIQLKMIQEQMQVMSLQLNEINKKLDSGKANPPVAKTVPASAPAKQVSHAAKQPPKATSPSKEPAAAKESPASITLKAVLDGRAWFLTKSGESLSVSEGDNIAGVGKVSKIDVDRGEVYMSNGLVYR
ncbi:hypothetical protein HBO23_32095 [Pseudomonas sp. WS 5532]|uniref:hypothetical protein n=1 Tax=Pseudomonas sp. WS 5532 TaxID=2717495 RepID=UPI001475C08F|nr:hypothetical protein [Pseudomonas sp. WS 5532]NMX77610.1 hypothetical protein [Pseudomonas sp. WS 5532]